MNEAAEPVMPTRSFVLTDDQDGIVEALVESGAITELTDAPDVAGSRARDDVMAGGRTLHVARRGQSGRHLLLYRAGADRTIEIGRIRYDRMDLPPHSPFMKEKGE